MAVPLHLTEETAAGPGVQETCARTGGHGKEREMAPVCGEDGCGK